MGRCMFIIHILFPKLGKKLPVGASTNNNRASRWRFPDPQVRKSASFRQLDRLRLLQQALLSACRPTRNVSASTALLSAIQQFPSNPIVVSRRCGLEPLRRSPVSLVVLVEHNVRPAIVRGWGICGLRGVSRMDCWFAANSRCCGSLPESDSVGENGSDF